MSLELLAASMSLVLVAGVRFLGQGQVGRVGAKRNGPGVGGVAP